MGSGSVLWCFPGWGSLCLCSGWWSWISSLWRAVQCPVVSMGPVCVWAVLLALAVLDTSISTAASKWPSQHISIVANPRLVSGIIAMLLFSCPALHCWPKLAGQGFVWIFSWLPNCALCVVETSVGFPQPPELIPCVVGLCTLVSASWSQPLHHRAWVRLSQLPMSSLCIAGLLCTCLGSRCPAFASRAYMRLTQLPRPGLCVAGLVCACLSPLGPSSASRGLWALVSAPGARPLSHGACVHLSGLPRLTLSIAGLVCACLGSLGSLSALRGLYVLVSAHWAHPLYHRVQFLYVANQVIIKHLLIHFSF